MTTDLLRVEMLASPGLDRRAAAPATGGKSGRILRVLEQRFGSGDIRFGQKLTVADLAKEFHVSRQPIMMALSELRNDGFVIITPQVGCHAASPSKAEIEDFFSVFAKMEGRIAGMAALRRDEGEVEVLSRVLAKIEASPGHPERWEPQQLDKAVALFHDLIRQMARSETICQRVARFWVMANYIIRNARHNYTDSRHKAANKERREILEAIAARDEAAAEAAMERHLLGKPKRVSLL